MALTAEVEVNEAADDDGRWANWIVAPDSGFRVDDEEGQVVVAQVSRKLFSVKTEFEFAHEPTLARYRDKLRERGFGDVEAKDMLDTARTFCDVPTDTDFASVPGFLGWFERSYGRHTLAAILHDQLIVKKSDGGALGSDTLADSFFRDMIGVAGVPVLKRWLMWTAVAARTRWAAGGRKRATLVLWGLLGVAGVALAGHALIVAALGTMAWSTVAVRVGAGSVLGVISSALWGRQWGAGLVAALTGVWLIPATIFVVIGLAVYWVMEEVAG